MDTKDIILAIFASGGFWSLLQVVIGKLISNRSAGQRLLLGLAFREIIETCQHYLQKGSIEAEEYKELTHYLFEPYKALGGDGTAERMIREVDKLAIAVKGDDR